MQNVAFSMPSQKKKKIEYWKMLYYNFLIVVEVVFFFKNSHLQEYHLNKM